MEGTAGLEPEVTSKRRIIAVRVPTDSLEQSNSTKDLSAS